MYICFEKKINWKKKQKKLVLLCKTLYVCREKGCMSRKKEKKIKTLH